jgi:hypothetical protein
MEQGVEHLPGKQVTLISNPSTTQKKKKIYEHLIELNVANNKLIEKQD